MVCYTAVRLASIAQWLKRYQNIRYYNVKASHDKSKLMTTNTLKNKKLGVFEVPPLIPLLAHFQCFMCRSYVSNVAVFPKENLT